MSIGLFVNDIKRAKQFFRDNPNGKVKLNWHTYFNRYEFQKWLLTCLHSKINRNEKRRGEKDDQTWFYDVRRIADRLNSRCIVRNYELNFYPKAQKRLINRLSHKSEF